MVRLSKRTSPEDQSPELPIFWIVLITIVVIIAISGVAAATFILVLKYRQRQPYYPVRPADYQSSGSTLPRKKFKESTSDSLESGTEHQREYMIRKSLASRTASNESHAQSATIDDEDQGESSYGPMERSRQNETKRSLVDDWKRFEAGIRRDNLRSMRRHPGMATPTYPAATRRTPEPLMRSSRPLGTTEEVTEEGEGGEIELQMRLDWGHERALYEHQRETAARKTRSTWGIGS
ncbi:hypothetical protein NOR_01990 [Metarhizium rileyi]|uniref:Uncharacterized protein n=1 Tax=Metarhizium rileyi (strain RCEF 4871) TaxID=1649241 RepID=A0A162M192_METRR|nr:hypothetical protein NOR_01990 [Metarhizium rileyi RCEF 4871]